MKVYASCSSYLLGRLVGIKEAERIMTRIAATGSDPCGADVPGALTIHELAKLHDVTLRVDGGAVCIGKSRSRAFHDALMSTCDVWVSVDDDVGASPETVRALVEAVEGSEPRVCLAPCLLRGNMGIASVEWSPVYLERKLSRGAKVRRALRGGFGLVAMNRPALIAAAAAAPIFIDDDGHEKAAVFLETLEDGRWRGEDFAFFHRLPASVHVEGLIIGETVHAGAKLNLAKANV